EPEANTPDNVAFQVRSLSSNLAAASGIASVTVADGLPLDFRGRPARVSAQAASEEAPASSQVQVTRVGDGYLRTMGIPLLSGRDFSADDVDGAAQVAIISKPLADRLFANGDAVGQNLAFGRGSNDTQGAADASSQELTIVGVTG